MRPEGTLVCRERLTEKVILGVSIRRKSALKDRSPKAGRLWHKSSVSEDITGAM